jgi:tRNA modification GTPase
MPRPNDTIAALATPVGTAALAVLRISGPDTRRIATELWGKAPLPRLVRHADYRDATGILVDDVVVTFFAGPHSYTGEDSMEISSHGNPFIAQRILEDLFQRGCRPAEAGEFTQRAFLNGKMDLSQAEAVMDLIHARSERALAAANNQLRGSLGRRMNELVDLLLDVIARIEAYIDFPEEDLPPEDREALLRDLGRLEDETGQLLSTAHYGEVLRGGIKTVIVGPPNVGKSSILNRLVGRDRALVSAEPGTTRDFIEETIMMGPHCVRVIDTAGFNSSPAPLEKLGIEKTYERLEEADLVICVSDVFGVPDQALSGMTERLSGRRIIQVINKIDIEEPCGTDAGSIRSGACRISAATLEGFEELKRRIVAHADQLQSEAGDEGVAVNARHAGAPSSAVAALRAAREKFLNSKPNELVTSDLRIALVSYGDVVGAIGNEAMLDRLFATFCVGK